MTKETMLQFAYRMQETAKKELKETNEMDKFSREKILEYWSGYYAATDQIGKSLSNIF